MCRKIGYMSFSQIELPSNRKFGFFFTSIFVTAAGFFFYSAEIFWTLAFLGLASIFLVVTLIKSEALIHLNKLWMCLGVLLGMLVSPIVLGIIFFGLFTPVAILMRLSGRDELGLKSSQKPSHWRIRSELITSESFKKQF